MHPSRLFTPRHAHEWPLPRKAAHAIEPLIKAALDAGRDKRPGRRQRVDGWTPDRIRLFLEVLAERGNITDAARAAGKTARAAYLLRDSERGHAFAVAWRAALDLARGHPAGGIVQHLSGRIAKAIIRNGQLWGWRLGVIRCQLTQCTYLKWRRRAAHRVPA